MFLEVLVRPSLRRTVPHGGFITACFLEVASKHFATTLAKQKQPHTISMHTEFVRRTKVGSALFTVKDVKLGRGTTTIHVTLSQDGQDEVLAYMTNSNMATETGVSYDTEWGLHPPVAWPKDLVAMEQGKDPHWQERKELPYSEFRKASRNTRYFFPSKGQPSPSIVDQWLKMKTGERFANSAVGFVADLFPQIPEVLSSGYDPYAVELEKLDDSGKVVETKRKPTAKFWYPTLLLNLDIKKRLPEDGVEWVFMRVRTKQIRNGRYDLEVIVYDETGDMVALSHHVCMILGSERNMSRKNKEPKL